MKLNEAKDPLNVWSGLRPGGSFAGDWCGFDDWFLDKIIVAFTIHFSIRSGLGFYFF